MEEEGWAEGDVLDSNELLEVEGSGEVVVGMGPILGTVSLECVSVGVGMVGKGLGGRFRLLNMFRVSSISRKLY